MHVEGFQADRLGFAYDPERLLVLVVVELVACLGVEAGYPLLLFLVSFRALLLACFLPLGFRQPPLGLVEWFRRWYSSTVC